MLPSIRCMLLDMDGVLWRGEEPLINIPATLAALENHQIAFAFVTNNSTRTPAQIAGRFEQFGATVNPNHIFTSSTIMAAILQNKFPHGGHVYIVGEAGLLEPLAACGFIHNHEKPLAVIVGLDRDFDYAKLQAASRYIRHGAEFYATNPDPTLPSSEGLLPGAGSIVAAIETASGRKAVVIGKPGPQLFRTAMTQLGYSPEDCLVVGDRLDTDILGGKAAGCRTGLVLSGATSAEAAARAAHRPDIIAQDLAELVDLL